MFVNKTCHLLQDGRGGYGKAKATGSHDYASKQRILLQNSRKLDCCATLQICCVHVFDDYFQDKALYKTDNSIKVAKSRILKSLDELLTNENHNDLCKTTRFYVKLPLNSVHTNHPVGSVSTIGQYVDPHLVSKIYSLVKKTSQAFWRLNDGLTSTSRTSCSAVFLKARNLARQIGCITHAHKICAIIS